MEKKELLSELITMKENNNISLVEIAEHLNLSEQIVTDGQKDAVAKINKLNELCGKEDVYEFVTSLLTEKKENELSVRNAFFACKTS